MKFLYHSYVKYGLILLVPLIICLFIMEITGNNESFDKSPIFPLIQFIAPAIVLYLGIKEKKEKLKNKLTFKQGVMEGFKISLVFAIVSPFVFLIYYTLINPPIIEYAKSVYQMSEASNATIITIDMLVQFFAATVFGTIYGAIVSFFLKTKS